MTFYLDSQKKEEGGRRGRKEEKKKGGRKEKKNVNMIGAWAKYFQPIYTKCVLS